MTKCLPANSLFPVPTEGVIALIRRIKNELSERHQPLWGGMATCYSLGSLKKAPLPIFDRIGASWRHLANRREAHGWLMNNKSMDVIIILPICI